jgi:hypothetical protein
MMGFNGMLNASRSDYALPPEYDKHHGVRFRMGRDHLPGFKADEDDVRTCSFHQVFFDRAGSGKFRCLEQICHIFHFFPIFF